MPCSAVIVKVGRVLPASFVALEKNWLNLAEKGMDRNHRVSLGLVSTSSGWWRRIGGNSEYPYFVYRFDSIYLYLHVRIRS
jgi:hypothetical protein